MAKLIRKNTEPPTPENNNGGKKSLAIFLLIVAFLSGFVFLVSFNKIALLLCIFSLLFSLYAFALSLSSSKSYDDVEIKRYGDAGERKAGFILERNLPENYTVIENSIIYYDGEKSEIDNIIVGRGGVFIVEVKNVKGILFGSYEDKYWVQDKVDRYDIEHQKTLYNPVKQTGTHIYRLANYLRDNKIFTHINGAVYFVNPETKLSISGQPKDVPIFTYSSTEDLLKYITNGTANLSDKTINKILSLLR